MDLRKAFLLVTPLRDGMNLVAKEYIAAQDTDDPGVLILSRFAGAAIECERAILVNPYDVESMTKAIQLALTMPLAERSERHSSMLATLRPNGSEDWSVNFLRSLESPEIEMSRPNLAIAPHRELNEIHATT